MDLQRGENYKMLGLPRGEVFLVPWTEDWLKQYLLEKDKIKNKIEDFIIDIHHIGSTAVKGLSAKPIIDIAVELKRFNDGKLCAAPLERLGYTYHGMNILPDRHYFSKGEPRTHQIHMFETRSKYLIDQLKFRDFLRSNANARRKYEKLKIQLADIYKHNKHEYADAKTDFVNSILGKV